MGKQEEFSIRFPDGFLCILGRNGSGKSSILHAIFFAFYGKTVNRLSLKDNLNLEDYLSDGQKLCSVTLEFSIGSDVYRIQRTLKKDKKGKVRQQSAKLYKEGLDTPIASTITEANSFINELIKLTQNALMSSNLILQKDVDGLKEIDQNKWNDAINVILNLETFTKSQKVLKNEIKSNLEPELNSKNSEFDEQKDLMEEYINDYKRLLALRKEYVNINHEWRNYKKIVEEYGFIEQNSIILSNLSDLNNDLKLIEREVFNSHQIKCQLINEVVILLKASIENNTLNDLPQIKDNLTTIKTKLETIHKHNNQINDIQDFLSQLIEKKTHLQSQICNKENLSYDFIKKHWNNTSSPKTGESSEINLQINELTSYNRDLDFLVNNIIQDDRTYCDLIQKKNEMSAQVSLINEIGDIIEIEQNKVLYVENFTDYKDLENQENELMNTWKTIEDAECKHLNVIKKLSFYEGIEFDSNRLLEAKKVETNINSSSKNLNELKKKIESIRTEIKKDSRKLPKEYQSSTKEEYQSYRDELKQELASPVKIITLFVDPSARVKVVISLVLIIFGISFGLLYWPWFFFSLVGISLYLIVFYRLKVMYKLVEKRKIIVENILELLEQQEELSSEIEVRNEQLHNYTNILLRLHEVFSNRIGENLRLKLGLIEENIDLISTYHNNIQTELDRQYDKRSELERTKEELEGIISEKTDISREIDENKAKKLKALNLLEKIYAKFPDRYRKYELSQERLTVINSIIENQFSEDKRVISNAKIRIENLRPEVEKIPKKEEALRLNIKLFFKNRYELDHQAETQKEKLNINVKKAWETVENHANCLPERYAITFEKELDSMNQYWDIALDQYNREEYQYSQNLEKIKTNRNSPGKLIEVKQAIKETKQKCKSLWNQVSSNLNEYTIHKHPQPSEFFKSTDHLEGVIDELLSYFEEDEELYDKNKELMDRRQTLKDDKKAQINRIWKGFTDDKFTLTVQSYFKVKVEKETLEYQIKVSDRSIKALKEVNAKILKDQTPLVEHFMSDYMGVISGGIYQNLKLEIIEKEKGGVERHYKVYETESGKYVKLDRMSGGTQDQIMFALRLAFGMTLLPRSEFGPQFLILDEVFSSSDPERRKNMINLIQTKLMDYFKQIIVITHLPDIAKEIPNSIEMSEGKIIY